MDHFPVVIIGAGPAGLTTAYELVNRGIQPILIEKSNKVGGLARTEIYKGYRFDIGGHRFFTKIEEVQQLWEKMLGKEFLKVSRLSRIYHQGRFFKYPLEPVHTLFNLGIIESFLILCSYIKAHLRPYSEEKTFEQWVVNRFGRRLYQTFFKDYTEKVWGIPCNMIQADWAAQRIQGLSLKTVVSNAVFGNSHAKSLISEFHYPVEGPGTMWQRFQKGVESRNGQVNLNTEVLRFRHERGRIRSIIARHDGKIIEISGEHFISSMPLTELVARLDPPPPWDVLKAANNLTHRDFTLVGLIVDRADLFPDQWIYVHSPKVKVGRIQNFKNWSAAMVPDPIKTNLGMEYFCTEGDAIWIMSDANLIALATRELAHLGLADISEVEDGVVFRQPKAYPIYAPGYRKHLEVIQQFLAKINNLQTIGRNGLHRYNNQDHSMLTGMSAVENILGAGHDLWELDNPQKYFE